eukprot:7460313-Pyramimonas_sp.AAC.1
MLDGSVPRAGWGAQRSTSGEAGSRMSPNNSETIEICVSLAKAWWAICFDRACEDLGPLNA